MTTSTTSWTQSRLAALYIYPLNAPETASSSFDTLFSPQAQIFVNHEPLTLEAFKNTIKDRAILAANASISWKDVFEVSKTDSPENEAGVVAGCFVVTRSLPFLIRAAPAQTISTVIFSAKIDRDPSITTGDARRIVHLFQTISDKPAPIHLHGIGDNS